MEGGVSEFGKPSFGKVSTAGTLGEGRPERTAKGREFGLEGGPAAPLQ